MRLPPMHNASGVCYVAYSMRYVVPLSMDSYTSHIITSVCLMIPVPDVIWAKMILPTCLLIACGYFYLVGRDTAKLLVRRPRVGLCNCLHLLHFQQLTVVVDQL